MQILQGHEKRVNALVFSADGESLASAGEDGSLRLWRTWGEGVELSRGASVLSLAAGASGPWLAAGRSDGSLEVWDLQDQKVKSVPPACGRKVTGLAFLSDDATLAFSLAEESGSPKLPPGVHFRDWRYDKVRPLPVSVATVIAVRFLTALAPLRLLAWVTDNRSIVVWNLLQSNSFAFNRKERCKAITLAPDGKSLAAAADWKVTLFDLERKQETHTLTGHKGPVGALAFSPDGRHLMTGSWDKTVKFWDPRTGREQTSFAWPVGRISAAGFAPDGLRAAVGDDLGAIVMWDVDS